MKQCTNIQKLSKTFLKNHWVKRKSKENFKKISETNKNVTHHNLWNRKKVVLKGKFTVINTYLKKREKPQISKQILYLKT